MTSLAPLTQLPEPFAFADGAAPLRPAVAPLTPREEVRLHLLAHEIARYAPDLAQYLFDAGVESLRSELVEA